MPRTFDIRFARATGLAGILEAPANTFRWRGAAWLSIDRRGVEIEPKRGLLSLLTQRARFRINAADLREVSRTGDALRIEFGIPGTRRAVLPFWVRDAGTADEIMRLVPTHRTVEIDATESRPHSSRRRKGGIAALALACAIGVIVGMTMVRERVVSDSLAPSSGTTPIFIPVTTSTTTVSPLTPGAAPMTSPSASSSRSPRAAPGYDNSSVRRVSPASPYGYGAVDADSGSDAQPDYVSASSRPAAVAVQEPTDAMALPPPRSDFFRAEALALQAEYLNGRTMPALQERWWALSVRLYNSPEFDDWRQRPLVDAQLGVSLNWRASLQVYADAIDSGNQARIDAARADLEAANELTDRVLGFSSPNNLP